MSWADETSVTYTKWQKSEPNSRSATSCVHTIIKTGAWNDHFCYVKKGFICKYDKGEFKHIYSSTCPSEFANFNPREML